jgi:putative N6-adenine-specific DNA methylase
MFLYQKTNQFFAQLADDLKEPGTAELKELQARNIRPVFRGIYFEADHAVLYRINYHSRILTRILAPLIHFPCHSTNYLYKTAKNLDWAKLFSPEQTFAVFANVSNSKIRHSQYAALCLKDAIVDWFNEHCNRRPSISRQEPDVWISLHIENDRAVISLDTSGGSLHRRGYRRQSVEAPMQETVAAAIIRLTEWDGQKPLYDPMAGSGTLLIEALMSFCCIPAGYLRSDFGFKFLPDFDQGLWRSIKKTSDRQIRPLPEGLIRGSDLFPQAVKACRANLSCLPFGDQVPVKKIDFRKIDSLENQIIVCNPPYGIRLGSQEDMASFYGELGDFFKQRCKGSCAFVYFGDRSLIPSIGLKPSWKKPISNGGLDGRLVKFEMY